MQKNLQQLIAAAPAVSAIQQHRMYLGTAQHFDSFQILEGKAIGPASLMLTPDYALCDDCRGDLHNARDYRYQYPFITCTQCGPGYSIIKALPYDRHTTSMASFGMCAVCRRIQPSNLQKVLFANQFLRSPVV
jgi:hydrogenase maturation protein HypF